MCPSSADHEGVMPLLKVEESIKQEEFVEITHGRCKSASNKPVYLRLLMSRRVSFG